MGMMVRILRICKADLHGVMDQIEDKGLLLKQYMREMESSLLQNEAGLEQLAHSRRRIEHDLDLQREELVNIGREIDLALSKSKDDIARLLIRKRRSLEAAAAHLQAQLLSCSTDQHQLEELSARQRLQYDQLKLKADAYLCREQLGCRDERSDSFQTYSRMASPTPEEIELELLQRKEALARGGAA